MGQLLDRILSGNNRLVLTIDCEGAAYDSDIALSLNRMNASIEYLGRIGIPVIVFLAPGFICPEQEKQIARMLSFGNLLTGLHLHIEDLPVEVGLSADLQKQGYQLLTDCPLSLKTELLAASIKHLSHYVIDVCGFRGGFFAMDNDVSDILKAYPGIVFESHNPHRQQYQVSRSHLQSLPVMARSAADELRIERFGLEKLICLFDQLKDQCPTGIAITHSYLFKDDNHLRKLYNFVNVILNQDIRVDTSH